MSPVRTILSIQSSVAYGHVGNSAATFPLMRMGVEVWPVLTVHFSNHTGYGAWRGPMLSRNPAAIYCCDPVLGDVGRGIFVRPGIPELMRDSVVPAAQVVTPNQFELDFLTGRTTRTMADVLAAADLVRERGPDVVLVTSVMHDRAEPDTVDMVAVSPAGAWSVTTPLLSRPFQGAGDLTAATFLAKLLQLQEVDRALAETADVVHAVLRATLESGQPELQLVAAQDAIVAPPTHFEVARLR
jgi:pyridoxine kinase